VIFGSSFFIDTCEQKKSSMHL